METIENVTKQVKPSFELSEIFVKPTCWNIWNPMETIENIPKVMKPSFGWSENLCETFEISAKLMKP